MPFARPTLTELRNQSLQDITTSGVPGLDGLLRNSVMRVLAWVMSGFAYAIYGYIDWIAREAVPFTATAEFLEAWAGLVGVLRKDASVASGRAQFNGVTNRVLPSGTPLRRIDGVSYVTTADGTIDITGSVVVPIRATSPGRNTDGADQTPISISTPIAGINAGGFLVGAATGGADQERDDELRSRMLQRYRDPPQGGAIADYIEWSTQVPGCTRAWCLPHGWGPGTVVIFPMFDDANSANDGFPIGKDGCAENETRGPTAEGDQRAIAEHIFPLQPVTALVYVAAPRPHPIDVTLYTLDPNTAEMQEQIVESIVGMLFVRGQVGGTIYPSDFYEAILATPGLNRVTVASPSLAVTVPMGELPVMGALSVSLADAD